MDFIERYLPSPFYMEKDVRVDVRNAIFRELVVNTLMHREFSMHQYARLIISERKILIENANKPHICGSLSPSDFRPYTKNPTIAKVFKEIGFAEELGSGIRNILKYSKMYFGTTPKFVDDTLFTTSIEITNPNFSSQNNQEIQPGDQDRHQDRDQVGDQVEPQDRHQDDLSQQILKICREPKTLKEIMNVLGYKDKTKFRRKYISQLLDNGCLKYTLPDKKEK